MVQLPFLLGHLGLRTLPLFLQGIQARTAKKRSMTRNGISSPDDVIGVKLLSVLALDHHVGVRPEVPRGVAHGCGPAALSAAVQRTGLFKESPDESLTSQGSGFYSRVKVWLSLNLEKFKLGLERERTS